MTPTYDALQEQVRELEGMLSQLRGDVTQQARLRMEFGLRPKHAAVLALLVNTARPISADAIYANVFEHPNGDGPVLATVKVSICQLRQRLANHSAPSPSIPSAYSTGCYYLTTEFRDWLAERLAPKAVAA